MVAAKNAPLPRPPAVARVVAQITRTARDHAMFEPGSTVLAAVSGGPDSMCLLHALVRVRRLLRITVAVAHVDHGLRPDSAEDARYVARQAERLGVAFALRTLTTRPTKGESVEAWARTARYSALLEVQEEVGAGSVALGHTMDDQAETVLLALVRGGGLDALAGMRPVSRPFVRPLLQVTRAQTEELCRALRLRPRRDPMNVEPAYLRAAIRNRVLPELERRAGRSVRATLARTATLLGRDADFLDALARTAASAVVRSGREGALLHAGGLLGLPEAIGSRVVRLELMGSGVVPEVDHVRAVLDLAAGRPGRRVSLAGGLLAYRDREYIRLVRPSLRPRD